MQRCRREIKLRISLKKKEKSLSFIAEECRQILERLRSKPSSANHVSSCSTHDDELSDKPFSLILNLKRNTWILDSGSTDHRVYDQNLFTHSRAIKNRTVELPNGSMAQVTHVGTVALSPDLIFDNVLCIPYFHLNLILISKLTHVQANQCFEHFVLENCRACVCYEQLHFKTKIFKGCLYKT